MVALEQVTCLYPGVCALDEVSLLFAPGEVHALAGENGAGKSTVLKVLSGLVRPVRGRITIGSSTYDCIENSHDLGIRMVPQEPVLVPHLSVAENVLLGRLPRNRFGIVDWSENRRRGQALLARVGLDPQLAARPASSLSTSQMQLVQVARALSDQGKIFLFDEPSSGLSPSEFANLKAVIRQLRAEGKVIVYVSHRIEEIFSLCDQISVLRDGKFIAKRAIPQTTPEELIRLMVGRDLELNSSRPRATAQTPVALAVESVGGIGLSVRRGEIVGLAGLVGAGRTELLETIFGVRTTGLGRVAVNGKDVAPGSPQASTAAGLALIPEDRKRDGLALNLSIEDNIAMTNLDELGQFGAMSAKRKRRLAQRVIDLLRVKCRKSAEPVRNLSGGNQQKVVIGKWLVRQPSVLLLDEPTRGVDIAAKAELHRLLRELALAGTAILVASSDMPELFALSDRILIICQGKLRGELARDEATEEAVLRLATPEYKISPEEAHAG